MLEEEFNYFKDNRDELLKKHRDKVLVIKGKQVVGVYQNEEEAYKDSISKFELGTFLIQRCVPAAESIQSFHTNVIFKD